MDITVPEEDIESIEIPIGGDNSGLSGSDKAKWAEAMKLDETPGTPAATPLEQAPEPEITADDIPAVETPQAGKKYKVKLDGVETEVDENELLSGYQLQAVSTKRFQEAARIKAEAEAMKEALSFYQQPVAPVYQPYQAPTGEIEFQTPTEKMLYDELQAVKGQVGSLASARDNDTRQSVFNKIDSELIGFREAHPELGEEQLTRIIQIANEDGTRPSKKAFERIFKAEFTDPQKIKDEAIAEYVKTLREKKKAAVAPSAEVGNAKPEPLDVRNMTDEQRHAAMLKELGY
jgi:hypothetical protein